MHIYTRLVTPFPSPFRYDECIFVIFAPTRIFTISFVQRSVVTSAVVRSPSSRVSGGSGGGSGGSGAGQGKVVSSSPAPPAAKVGLNEDPPYIPTFTRSNSNNGGGGAGGGGGGVSYESLGSRLFYFQSLLSAENFDALDSALKSFTSEIMHMSVQSPFPPSSSSPSSFSSSSSSSPSPSPAPALLASLRVRGGSGSGRPDLNRPDSGAGQEEGSTDMGYAHGLSSSSPFFQSPSALGSVPALSAALSASSFLSNASRPSTTNSSSSLGLNMSRSSSADGLSDSFSSGADRVGNNGTSTIKYDKTTISPT